MTAITQSHKLRTYKELRDAGVGKWGMRSAEARHVPLILHPDEHIGAVVYGHSDEGFVMMIATDKRVIYLDRKILFTTIDEITYDVVSGVKCNDLGLFAGVTLHTRIKDYSIKWVNETCAHKFVQYIEARRLERNGQTS